MSSSSENCFQYYHPTDQRNLLMSRSYPKTYSFANLKENNIRIFLCHWPNNLVEYSHVKTHRVQSIPATFCAKDNRFSFWTEDNLNIFFMVRTREVTSMLIKWITTLVLMKFENFIKVFIIAQVCRRTNEDGHRRQLLSICILSIHYLI